MADVTITRKRGDTYPDVFSITLESTGEPLDITGYSFLLTVDPAKAPADDTNNLFQIVGVIEDAVNGQVSFAPSEVQSNQTPGTYYYDGQLTDADGNVRTFVTGKYKIVQDITK